uniref:Uncharacterized protein n=1 Tax=Anguilla anguilla TaxID=7936 RepID=A0A0E9WXS1_ANGAN
MTGAIDKGQRFATTRIVWATAPLEIFVVASRRGVLTGRAAARAFCTFALKRTLIGTPYGLSTLFLHQARKKNLNRTSVWLHCGISLFFNHARMRKFGFIFSHFLKKSL